MKRIIGKVSLFYFDGIHTGGVAVFSNFRKCYGGGLSKKEII
jgi:hypothetical protein